MTYEHPTLEPDDDPVLVSVAAYSAHADEYAEAYSQRMLDRPHRFAESLPTPSLILDVGCGPGRDLGIFARHGHVAVGVELNPRFVDMATLHAPTLCCDLREVNAHFPAGAFDGVWAQASLVHLDEVETADVLAQLAGLLRTGGRLFACVRATGRTGWLDEPDGRRWYTVWDAERFADVVTAAGFTDLEVHDGPYVEVWATRR